MGEVKKDKKTGWELRIFWQPRLDGPLKQLWPDEGGYLGAFAAGKIIFEVKALEGANVAFFAFSPDTGMRQEKGWVIIRSLELDWDPALEDPHSVVVWETWVESQIAPSMKMEQIFVERRKTEGGVECFLRRRILYEGRYTIISEEIIFLDGEEE